jgi:DNA-binding response OmpR family regulator
MLTEQVHADAPSLNPSRTHPSSAHADWLRKHWEQNALAIQSWLTLQTSSLEASSENASIPEGIVLMVDDEPAVAITLSQILNRHGFASVWSTDPHHAASLLGRLPLRLLITDIDMPDMDGVTLASMARNLHSDCPVLLFSARGANCQRAKRLSASDSGIHIQTKPVAIDVLLERVRTLYRSPQALSRVPMLHGSGDLRYTRAGPLSRQSQDHGE